jgi:hypothetical protein
MNDLITQAIFQSARTTIDGGWRITFDLSEQEAEFVTKLSKLKSKQLFLVVQVRDELTPAEDIDIEFDQG